MRNYKLITQKSRIMTPKAMQGHGRKGRDYLRSRRAGRDYDRYHEKGRDNYRHREGDRSSDTRYGQFGDNNSYQARKRENGSYQQRGEDYNQMRRKYDRRDELNSCSQERWGENGRNDDRYLESERVDDWHKDEEERNSYGEWERDNIHERDSKHLSRKRRFVECGFERLGSEVCRGTAHQSNNYYKELSSGSSETYGRNERSEFCPHSNYAEFRTESCSHVSSLRSDDTDDFRRDYNYLTEYKSLKEDHDIVSEFLSFILNKGGIVKYSELSDFGFLNTKFSHQEDVKVFIEEYDDLFRLQYPICRFEEQEEVKALTTVKLCPDFSNKPESCKGDCNAFHICRFHVLSSCGMIKCKFGHQLDDDHNNQVRRMFCLHRVSFKNICRLLRHYENRCRVTVPIICSFYNSKRCKNSETCPYLHLCLKYVEGNCNSMDCQLLHNLEVSTVVKILSKYGLNPWDVPEDNILKLLRKSLNDFKEECKLPKSLNLSSSAKKPRYLTGGSVESNTRNQTGENDVEYADLRKGKDSILTSKLIDTAIGDNVTTIWSIPGAETTFENKDMQKIEEMYQAYIKTKNRTMRVDGKMLQIDFQRLSCCFPESKKTLKLLRKPKSGRKSLDSISSSATLLMSREGEEEISSEEETEAASNSKIQTGEGFIGI